MAVMSAARFDSCGFLPWKPHSLYLAGSGAAGTHGMAGALFRKRGGFYSRSLAVNSRDDARCHMQREGAMQHGVITTDLQ